MQAMAQETPAILFAVVKILSDRGLKKTLKKLRKETQLENLTVDNIPSSLADADFEDFISALVEQPKKKKHKKSEKKRKIDENPEKLPEQKSESAEPQTPVKPTSQPNQEQNSNPVTSGTPFKRIQDDFWLQKIENKKLLDNQHNKDDVYSAKAAKELGAVKGKDFRHQKAKKKKASWKGCGEITTKVNSIMFEDSD